MRLINLFLSDNYVKKFFNRVEFKAQSKCLVFAIFK